RSTRSTTSSPCLASRSSRTRRSTACARRSVVSDTRPLCSVIVPVYRNEETLPALVERLDGLAREFDGPLEAVFVVDGSPDASLLVLRRLLSLKHRFSSQLIALSRNFGSFSAIRAGLAAADGEYMAMMAADLQEPVELVRDFFHGLAGGEHDIAIGV